jgi:hypothetical protein
VSSQILSGILSIYIFSHFSFISKAVEERVDQFSLFSFILQVYPTASISMQPMGIVPTSRISNNRKYLPTSLTPSTIASQGPSTPSTTRSPFKLSFSSSNMKHPGMFGLKKPCAIKRQGIRMEADC